MRKSAELKNLTLYFNFFLSAVNVHASVVLNICECEFVLL